MGILSVDDILQMQRFKRYKEVNVKTGCRHVAKWVFPVPRSRQDDILAIANEAQAAQFPSIQLRSQMDLLIPLKYSWFRKVAPPLPLPSMPAACI
ncbi:hypothetical protein A3Q35_18610 [Aeribacillus pallidus]|nr:hypothetical protein A3Q35_18610 [Aeribacillus pallidus]